MLLVVTLGLIVGTGYVTAKGVKILYGNAEVTRVGTTVWKWMKK